MGEMVEIETLDGTSRFGGYCARPSRPARAAIVIAQEIFGLNPGLRRTVEQWAERGYLAVAPDLFWRLRPGVELDPEVPAERDEALKLIGRYDVDAGVRDLEATLRWARAASGGGKVAVVGFCFGGRLAFLAATRTDADASVGYYGGGIEALLPEAHAIARPLMLHFGEEDSHIPVQSVFRIRETLAGNRHVEIHTYPGAGHGFAASTDGRRHDAAARAADARTEQLLAATLA